MSEQSVTTILAVCALVFTFTASAQSNSELVLEVLPSPSGGVNCDAYDINENGDVLGWCEYDSLGNLLPVLWVDGEAVWLDGPLEIVEQNGDISTEPLQFGFRGGINDRGQIAAVVLGTATVGVAKWTGDSWRLLAEGATAALEINNKGEIAGRQFNQAVIISESAITQLPSPPWAAVCTADHVNERGQVAGECFDEVLATFRPVFWDAEGNFTELASDNLSDFQFARRLNRNGLVVGSESDRAVKWVQGQAVELASPGWATGVNDRGDIVGFVGLNGGLGDDAPAAALWPAGSTTPILLPELIDSQRSFARSINNVGRICGLVCLEDGSTEGACYAAVWQ